MIKFPKGLLSLSQAAEQYGLQAVSLRDYVRRGRLEAVKIGKIWYTTERAMRQYLHSRELKKIPLKYRIKT